jgi:hypothetical protein
MDRSSEGDHTSQDSARARPRLHRSPVDATLLFVDDGISKPPTIDAGTIQESGAVNRTSARRGRSVGARLAPPGARVRASAGFDIGRSEAKVRLVSVLYAGAACRAVGPAVRLRHAKLAANARTLGDARGRRIGGPRVAAAHLARCAARLIARALARSRRAAVRPESTVAVEDRHERGRCAAGARRRAAADVAARKAALVTRGVLAGFDRTAAVERAVDRRAVLSARVGPIDRTAAIARDVGVAPAVGGSGTGRFAPDCSRGQQGKEHGRPHFDEVIHKATSDGGRGSRSTARSAGGRTGARRGESDPLHAATRERPRSAPEIAKGSERGVMSRSAFHELCRGGAATSETRSTAGIHRFIQRSGAMNPDTAVAPDAPLAQWHSERAAGGALPDPRLGLGFRRWTACV